MWSSVLERLGVGPSGPDVVGTDRWGGAEVPSLNPATGELLGRVHLANAADYERCVEESRQAFQKWRQIPAPQRGEVIRQLGLALREAKTDLGLLVTLEAGKIR
ncbi:MAG: aldehyde dehydrogenase family protein, partial [Planctomycetales bacterium]